ncbi:MAG TPA: MBL fold metallo-hydrolase [Candidatus Dormibacteraeota bacterium]|nr:MBL fold metallo-hydrolase [Candidatus Dormibacteraeota bacterium]
MRVRLWGTRGSVAAPGTDTVRYGGNTSCVEVRGADGTLLVLDAGTGIRPLGRALGTAIRRVHILLTHFHLDHIQGLGFFAPLYDPDVETHLWGPASTMLDLRTRLMRYLSPPLFPVHLRDLPHLVLHDLPAGDFDVGEFCVRSERVCHPGFTVGYRITARDATLTYLSDHEPALGMSRFPGHADWTSGHALARDADLLVHDAQYSLAEYAQHIGWGHSALEHAIAFADLAQAKHLVTFHHDPAHDDEVVDRLTADATASLPAPLTVTAGAEGAVFEL